MKPVSVSVLNSFIKRILASDPLLSNLSCKGEISNLKYHDSGNIFFTLKDDKSSIRCLIPLSIASRLLTELKDEMEAVLHGYISVYEKQGNYSLIVKDIEILGKGELAFKFEMLKKKLYEAGLFDPALKKDLPSFPEKVAVITSPVGAAIRDIIKISEKRFPLAEIRVFPSLVQGELAPTDIVYNLDIINRDFPDTELIIVGRGGGSLEDLWAFNEEVVALKIAESKIPVISAVGHENDITISDFVADKRASTPSNSIEIALPDINALRTDLYHKRKLLTEYCFRILERKQNETNFKKTELINSITGILNRLQFQIDERLIRLKTSDPNKILDKGYAYIVDENKTASTLKPGDFLTLILRDGKIKCEIKEVESNEKI